MFHYIDWSGGVSLKFIVLSEPQAQ